MKFFGKMIILNSGKFVSFRTNFCQNDFAQIKSAFSERKYKIRINSIHKVQSHQSQRNSFKSRKTWREKSSRMSTTLFEFNIVCFLVHSSKKVNFNNFSITINSPYKEHVCPVIPRSTVIGSHFLRRSSNVIACQKHTQ